MTNILKVTGKLYLWGDNENNVLGLGEGIDTSVPREIIIPEHFITHVECGFRHTLALTNENQILSWGYSRHGVLGLETEETVTEPTLIRKFRDGDVELETPPKIIKITSGGMHAAALSDNGEVFVWGEGRYFRNCQETEKDVLVPTKVSHPAVHLTTDISCSSGSTILLQGHFYTTILIRTIN